MSDESDSDLDYVPSDGEPVSEEEESGDDESWLKNVVVDDHTELKTGVKRKKGKVRGQPSHRKRTGGIQLDDVVEDVKPTVDAENERLKEEIIEEEKQCKEEKEEKRKMDLWSSFLSDVGQRPKKNSEKSIQPSESDSSKPRDTLNTTRPPETLSVTKTYNFAGENIKVTEVVDVKSKEGQAELKRLEGSAGQTTSTTKDGADLSPVKKPVVTAPARTGGLSGVLGKLNKPTKISCLDKSKMDWDLFKKKEGIEEELTTHNKGKEGYVERLDFLGRTDQRQFEIERNLRQSSRKYLP